jgi:hypothetical protein
LFFIRAYVKQKRPAIHLMPRGTLYDTGKRPDAPIGVFPVWQRENTSGSEQKRRKISVTRYFYFAFCGQTQPYRHHSAIPAGRASCLIRNHFSFSTRHLHKMLLRPQPK